MSTEELILTPLDDTAVDTGYKPNFSWPDKAETDAKLAQWGQAVLGNADSEGYAIMAYPEMLAGLAKILGYDQLFLNEDQWRVRDSLYRAGLGMAPDSVLERFSLKGHDNVVAYRAEQEVPTVKTHPYKKALLMVKFMTLMLPEMDANELARAGVMIDEWIRTPRYRRHLRGVLRWFNQRRRLLDARTKRMFRTIMTPDDMRQMSRQLLSMAAARGAALDAKSVYQLDRLLVMCGHQPGEVHSLLHRMQCGGRAIEEHYGGTEAVAPVWDAQHLMRIESETAAVQSLLSDVLAESACELEEAEAEETPKQAAPAGKDGDEVTRKILSREEWTTAELEAICQEAGKNMGVLLEEINDRAMDAVGDTIIDLDGDKAYVTTAYADALLGS